MRLKLWLSLGIVVLALASIAGGTLALWTGAASNDDNRFSSGTVKILGYRDMGDTIPGPLFYTNSTEGQTPAGIPGRLPTGLWLPGKTVTRALFVENRGTLDVWLKGVGADDQAGSSRYLEEKLQVKVTTDAAGTDVLVSGSLADIIDADQAFIRRLALNVGPVPSRLFFHVTLPADADNSYQALTLRVNFHVLAEQKTGNP